MSGYWVFGSRDTAIRLRRYPAIWNCGVLGTVVYWSLRPEDPSVGLAAFPGEGAAPKKDPVEQRAGADFPQRWRHLGTRHPP